MTAIYLISLALVLVILTSIRFVRSVIKFFKQRSILKRIPGPPAHWLLGNIPILLNSSLGKHFVMHFGLTPVKLANNSEVMLTSYLKLVDFINVDVIDEIFYLARQAAAIFWPIYRFDAVYSINVTMLHPCDIEMVLGNMKHIKKSDFYSMLHTWLGEGLLTSKGKKWHGRRKILTPAFHFNMLQEFLTVFNEETEKMIKQLEKVSQEPYVDVVPYVSQMTLLSIGETAMGLSHIDPATQQTYKNFVCKLGKLYLVKLVKLWYRIPLIYYFTKMRKEEMYITKYLHNFAYGMIKLRENKLKKYIEQNKGQGSYSVRKNLRMLDLLLMTKMEGHDIDLDGIREEVDTFMFEGHDTTSMAITYLLLMLANHQDIQKIVCQEISDIIGEEVPTYDTLQDLKYTERVIKETLRLYPSVPFISRVSGEDFVTHTGYLIPKGTVINVHIFDLHRDPKIYPDPDRFDPDRFLPENCQRHPFAYIPFSAGPRNCIGQKFAILELKAVLCGVLRKFSLEQVDTPSDIKLCQDLVLRPKAGVRIKFVPK